MISRIYVSRNKGFSEGISQFITDKRSKKFVMNKNGPTGRYSSEVKILLLYSIQIATGSSNARAPDRIWNQHAYLGPNMLKICLARGVWKEEMSGGSALYCSRQERTRLCGQVTQGRGVENAGGKKTPKVFAF